MMEDRQGEMQFYHYEFFLHVENKFFFVKKKKKFSLLLLKTHSVWRWEN